MEPLLKAQGLSVRLGGALILKDVGFELAPGQELAVLGPNGAGKTVLLRALLGLLPYEGQVSWKPGIRVGYVPQKVALSRDMPLTVADFFSLKKVPAERMGSLLGEVGAT